MAKYLDETGLSYLWGKIKGAISGHAGNTSIHVTSDEKSAWNAKLDSFTETDPTVPSWAKASSKPSYTASEVGALPISGGTLTGNLTGKYITGTWLQSTADNHMANTSAKVAVLDASGWVYYRTIAELLADLGIPDATSIRATASAYGTTKLSTSVTSTSKSLAATPYAVKTALDNAKAYTDSAIGDAIAASY